MTSSTRLAIACAAGVSFEDRQNLLGHKAAHATTYYSAADIGDLIAASEKACDMTSRKSPALSIVQSGVASQVPEIAGGKGGTRTLDPGIMRSNDDKEEKELQQVAWSVVQLSAVCGLMSSAGYPWRRHKKWHTTLRTRGAVHRGKGGRIISSHEHPHGRFAESR
jgi:hypothetical protein